MMDYEVVAFCVFRESNEFIQDKSGQCHDYKIVG
jgi:hypothetical protein